MYPLALATLRTVVTGIEVIMALRFLSQFFAPSSSFLPQDQLSMSSANLGSNIFISSGVRFLAFVILRPITDATCIYVPLASKEDRVICANSSLVIPTSLKVTSISSTTLFRSLIAKVDPSSRGSSCSIFCLFITLAITSSNPSESFSLSITLKSGTTSISLPAI